ncbi:MAG: hypothetical protein H7175_14125 [Burkholderiales bacterium]|nr:hypothetical protein [Anaerolineae bacterium]
MSQPPFDFLNLLVRPPGDLLYFLAVLALSLTGFFMAFGQRLRRPKAHSFRRYTLAMLGVVVAWALLMVGALFALLTNQEAVTILPPLERAANVITLLLLGWAFLTADNQQWTRASNIILLLFLATVIVGYMVTGSAWPAASEQLDFNQSVYGLMWSFIPAVLSLLGMILIIAYFRVVADAPLKLVFFAVLLIGYGATLLQIWQDSLSGDYAGASRLAFLAALPIIPAIIYRMVVTQLQGETVGLNRVVSASSDSKPSKPSRLEGQRGEDSSTVSPIERESVLLLKALGLILEDVSPESIPLRVVTASIEVLKADVGALLTLQDANYADITAAYDGTQKRKISGMALNLNDQPTLVNAIERRMQRPMFADRNPNELHDLYTRLDIEKIGPAYVQPLTRDGELVAVLVIGLPYTERELDSHERELLRGIGLISGRLLALSFAANASRMRAEERAIQAVLQGVSPDEIEDDAVIAARQEMQASLELARQQIVELTGQVTHLKLELDDERSRLSAMLGDEDSEEGLSISQRIIALNTEQEQLRNERDRLASRLQEAETALVGATATDEGSVFDAVVEALRREKDELLTQRENLRTQLDEVRSVGGVVVPQVVQEVLQSMGEERARLEIERDQLSGKLVNMEYELKSLGIEDGPVGLTQLIAQLHEQRAALQTKNDALRRERDLLVSERQKFESAISHEKERDQQLQLLQNEMHNLAADREAVTKQRDKLRLERDDLYAKQETMKQQRARLVAQTAAYQEELGEAYNEQQQLRAELQKLADDRSDLMAQLDRLLAENKAVETERDQLMARIEGDRARLQQLGENGVGSLTRMVEELSDQRNRLEKDLHETRTKLATVENQLDMMRVNGTASGDTDNAIVNPNPELLLGVLHELRTPMTSIVGYVELLLGESAGILGEMQRKFLQRVSVNVNRLAVMIDDMVHLMSMESGRFSLAPEPVDVISLVEDVITASTTQFREKGLTVHLNLDDTLPMLRCDRDAIHQIFNQLLTNAYLISPPNSEIFISARRRKVVLAENGASKTPIDSLFVSIEDRGGGISPDDQARVFSRKYKAENPLIQGIGDTGVGLSIAKALVEAHGGLLWLESRDGVGSIFNFALPFNLMLEPES